MNIWFRCNAVSSARNVDHAGADALEAEIRHHRHKAEICDVVYIYRYGGTSIIYSGIYRYTTGSTL
jgi:hypothetical protein